MVRRTRSKREPFAHPAEGDFDYDALIEAMAACHREVIKFQRVCGLRNPAYNEARLLTEQLRALALLTRVPDAESRVIPPAQNMVGPAYGA